MPSFLLEIGAEELPVAFLASTPSELSTTLEKLLADVGVPLSPEQIQTFAAPRRLAWLIQNLPQETQPRTERLKGPPLRVAIDEKSGQPTPAGLGFAQKMKVSFESLEQADGYLWVTQTTPGQSLSDLLTTQLPSVITSLSGAHFMRWQADTQEGIKFSRPIRWLTALWDDRPLTFSLAGITSDLVTRGLRLIPGDLALSHANDYLDVLRVQGKIEPDDATRRQSIEKQLHDAAREAGGALISNEDLLTMVTRMNESATVFTGRFDEKFLALPACVLTTVLASHQKLFAVKNAHTEALLPVFLGVSNNPNREAQATIAAGNERVVRARFQDAQFFFETDRKHSLEYYAQKLDGVTFQKNLGTMRDKTERLIPLTETIGRVLNLSDADLEHAKRAAALAKADLVTLLVREFTELQGELGGEYARLDGKPDAVASAITYHYHPRSEDELVKLDAISLTLNLADKLDTLVAIFSQKDAKLPTGSKDPLGLRRAASGVLKILDQNNLSITLSPLLKAAHHELSQQQLTQLSHHETQDRLIPFIEQRAKIWLKEQKVGFYRKPQPLKVSESPELDQKYKGGINQSVIEAVWQKHPTWQPLDHWVDVVKTIGELDQLWGIRDSILVDVIEAATRVDKILAAGTIKTSEAVSPSLFETAPEKTLWNAFQAIQWPSNFQDRIVQLDSLSKPIHAFFDNVLVNAEDPAVKANRLALLQAVHDLYCQVARFSLIQV